MMSRNTSEFVRAVETMFEEGKYYRCVELLGEYLGKNIGNSRIWYMFGTALSDCGRGEEAIEAFFKALEKCPKSKRSWIYAKIGETCKNHRSTIEAEFWYKKATNERNSDPLTWAFIYRGINLVQLGRYKEGKNCLEKVLKINDDLKDEAYANLASIYAIQGDYDKSLVAIKKALELEPGNGKYLRKYQNIKDVYKLKKDNEPT